MAQTTNTLRNATDASVTSGNPSTNYADAKQLHLQNGTPTAYAFLHFNRSFPLGATIIYAKLRVYAKGSWGISPTLTVRRATERWGVNKITSNNQPTVSAPVVQVTKSSAVDGDLWEFDVTTAMQSVSNGAVWFGFRIGTDNANARYLYSSDARDFKPELEIRWSEAPQAPTSLSPSGSQVVSIAKPVLSFDFVDRAGSTAMAALQVQIDAGGNFTTPAFDSGTVTATEPELDLSTTAYASLSAGVETRWRARVQDGSGLWSPWSDVVRFRRDNKGTLTITNPPSSGIISEWTPRIIWGLTGETQTAWQVFITPADDPGTRLYDTGRTKGTDTSWTLPKAVIFDDNDYRAVVRIWDSKDRVKTGSDRPYTEAVQTFHFNEDPTPNAATGLTAVNLLPRSRVQLDWSRATAPDSFTILRNDRPIETAVAPVDVSNGGTTYRWVDKEAPPGRQHVYKVQSTVNAKTSTGNPTVTITPRTTGVWLTNPDTDVDVFIVAGRDPASGVSMGEEATTHFPVGSETGVRITQGMRGWEGTVSGRLHDKYGFTAEQWQNRLWKLKERPGEVLVLTLGQEAFRVVVGNVVSTPIGDLPTTKSVSFEFWSVGRLPFDPRW